MARTLPPVLRTSLAWERLEVDMLCEAGVWEMDLAGVWEMDLAFDFSSPVQKEVSTPRGNRRRRPSWPSLDFEEDDLTAPKASPIKIPRCSAGAGEARADLESRLEWNLQTPEPKSKVSTPPAPCPELRLRHQREEVKTAIQNQSVPLLQLCLRRGAALGCQGRAEHCLHEAVNGHHTEALKFLLDHGMKESINATCCGFTPLHRAVRMICRKDDSAYEMAALLLQQKACTDVASSSGYQPLHDAAVTASSAAVELLLAHGSDANAATSGGRTALHLACRRTILQQDPEVHCVVEALLRSGADPTRRDLAGLRPSDAACSMALEVSELQLMLLREERWRTRRVALLLWHRGYFELPEPLFQAVTRFL
ncbi:unnamed protein product [Effrenium voratum]|nr:unnamed protein product [Effrenium voratum]